MHARDQTQDGGGGDDSDDDDGGVDGDDGDDDGGGGDDDDGGGGNVILAQHQQLSGESSISTDPESNDMTEDCLQQVPNILYFIVYKHR